jgi:hydrogenase maturation protease
VTMVTSNGSGPRIVVAGWGNTLRGDDGAGCAVAATIGRLWSGNLVVLIGPHPLPEWAATLAEADIAYLIDATSDPRLRKPRVTAMSEPSARLLPSGHALGPADVLALTVVLFGRSPKAYLIEIPSVNVELGEGFSVIATRSVDEAVAWLDVMLGENRCTKLA